MAVPFTPSREGNARFADVLFVCAILPAYLSLRVFAWLGKETLLEDHDSVGYLSQIETFRSFDLDRISALGPDATPFYPVIGALFSLFGLSVETSARLVSLGFSALLLLAIFGIARRIAAPIAIAVALLLLAFNPVLIRHSYGVLSEPSYVGTVYLGLWLFVAQYREARPWVGALLGVVFGLCFLNRLEGVLFLAAIPMLQLAHFLFERRRRYDVKRLAAWAALFVVGFALVAAPQVWRVSHAMGEFALNGRQAWSILLNNPDGKSYDAKIYGLDYSPEQINIDYVRENYSALDKTSSGLELGAYPGLVIDNFGKFYTDRLGDLIGPFGIAFFGIGMVALWRAGHRFEAFLVLAFIGIALAAPLLHNVKMRHVIVLAPIIVLVAGIGVYEAARVIAGGCATPSMLQLSVAVVLLGAVIAAYGPQFQRLYLWRDSINSEYRPERLAAPIEVVRGIAETELNRRPVVAARKSYLAYFADADRKPLPYATYEDLVRYLELNDIDFAYLTHRLVQSFPFMNAFRGDTPPPRFNLVYRGTDRFGERIELYRFIPTAE